MGVGCSGQTEATNDVVSGDVLDEEVKIRANDGINKA